MTDLKPCPFCGAQPGISMRRDGMDIWTVRCPSTNTEHGHVVVWAEGGTEAEAVANWNRRTPILDRASGVGVTDHFRAAVETVSEQTGPRCTANGPKAYSATECCCGGDDGKHLPACPAPMTVAEADKEAKRLPMQPIVTAPTGEKRFRPNVLVRWLLDNGGKTMNDLIRVDCPREDMEQFAQLIGYSLAGYEELSYVSDESVEDAFRAAEGKEQERSPCLRCGRIDGPQETHTCPLFTPAAHALLTALAKAHFDAEKNLVVLKHSDVFLAARAFLQEGT